MPDGDNCAPARSTFATAAHADDGLHVDPGRLIENAYRERVPADAPETYLLAWLAILPSKADAPRAAASLLHRLVRLQPLARSPWQHRVIELLELVAKHRRRATGGASSSVQFSSAKGKS